MDDYKPKKGKCGKRPNFHGNATSFKKGQVPWNKKPHAVIECKVCHTSMELAPWQSDRKFCSKKCAYEGRELKGLFEKGHPDLVPSESRGHTEESKAKMSKSHIGKHVGPLAWNWKGGVSGINNLVRSMIEYRDWRSNVFSRDDYTCQFCGTSGTYLNAHHIKPFSRIMEDNNILTIFDARDCLELWDISNGITLCDECHALTDTYMGRARRNK